MTDINALANRIDQLMKRFSRLENHVFAGSQTPDEDQPAASPVMHYCGVPVQPPREFGPEVSVDRAEAIINVSIKWVNKTNIHYYFFNSGPFGGDNSQQEVVREAFQVWKDVGIGLTFTEVSAISEAEIRIGFQPGGSWSVLGTQALRVGQQERTMNFGWNINVPGPNGLDTAIHEIGHALGFYHEHQNPNAGLVWDREAVYDYFARTQNPPWTREKTNFNILNTVSPSTVEGTTWDPNSVMHYAFAAGLIREPQQYRNGLTPQLGLSPKDIEVVKRFYPDPGTGNLIPELKPGESQWLSLAAGEQKDFNVLPMATRTYEFKTFGRSDTVMVLFEAEGDTYRYVQGDDDSGVDRNASFRVRLVRGHKYQLRVRLYYSFATGDTSVMMW